MEGEPVLAPEQALLRGFPVIVQHSPQKGRYLVASRLLEAGEEVYSGWTAFYAVADAFHKRVCACCLLWGSTGVLPFSCRICCWSHYCSHKCVDLHAPIHRVTCPLHRTVCKAESKFGESAAAALRMLVEVAQVAIVCDSKTDPEVYTALREIQTINQMRLTATLDAVRAAYRSRDAAVEQAKEEALCERLRQNLNLPTPAVPQRSLPSGSSSCCKPSDEVTCGADGTTTDLPILEPFALRLPAALFRADPTPPALPTLAELLAQFQLLCHSAPSDAERRDWVRPLECLDAAISAATKDVADSSSLLGLLTGEWLAHRSRIERNAFGIYGAVDPTTEDGVMVGRAVCPGASFFNHSCAPNCRRLDVHPALISIRTTAPVPEGTELTIAYIDTNVPQRSRRTKLQDVYAFHCDCDRCVQPVDEERISYPSRNSAPHPKRSAKPMRRK